MKNMTRILAVVISIVLGMSVIVGFGGFANKYDLIINNSIVFTESKAAIKDKQGKLLEEFKEKFVDECETNIIESFDSENDIEKLEYSVAVVENDLYNYTIEVEHLVEVVEKEKIAFKEVEQELEDGESPPEYNEVVKEGKDGLVTKKNVIKYVDGEYMESSEEIVSKEEAENRVIIVGLKGEKDDNNDEEKDDEDNNDDKPQVATNPSRPNNTQRPVTPESKPVTPKPVTPKPVTPEPVTPEPDPVELPEIGYYRTFYSLNECIAYGEEKKEHYVPGTTWYECYEGGNGTYLFYWFEYN